MRSHIHINGSVCWLNGEPRHFSRLCCPVRQRLKHAGGGQLGSWRGGDGIFNHTQLSAEELKGEMTSGAANAHMHSLALEFSIELTSLHPV